MIRMDMKTKQIYEAAIEEYKKIIVEMENNEEWDIVEPYKEKLIELIDEYDYFMNNEDAFQKYLIERNYMAVIEECRKRIESDEDMEIAQEKLIELIDEYECFKFNSDAFIKSIVICRKS